MKSDYKTRAQMRREYYKWCKLRDSIIYGILFIVCSGVFSWAIFRFITGGA